MNWRLLVAYDGSRYHGFQLQAGGLDTVQARLEAALADLAGEPIRVVGAGRTDAGVHAWGQVAGFRAGLRIPAQRLPYALNQRLPEDIVVRAAAPAGDSFHPRFSARRKHYRYTIWRAPFPSPFWRRYSWHVPQPLRLEEMRAAAGLLIGRHDFSAFAASSGQARRPNPVRTIHRAEWTAHGACLVFDVVADGFLYRMVRLLVGAMVQVGRGVSEVDEVAARLSGGAAGGHGSRAAAATLAAPAHGLCLVAVHYDGDDPDEARQAGDLPGPLDTIPLGWQAGEP